jgi:prephenate dehydrogenase
MDAAASHLFKKAKCIITPGPRTDKKALEKIRDLWKSVGSETVLMSPEEHDLIFAAVSHFPHVVAYSLVNAISDISRSVLQYGGRGLRDTTRIALSPADMWRDICAKNRKDMLRILKGYSASLTGIIRLFEKSDWKGLEKEFKRAQEARKLIGSD